MGDGERIDVGRLIEILRRNEDGFACDDAFDMASELDQSYSNQLPVLFGLVESTDFQDSAMVRHFAFNAILGIDPLGPATEALVRRLAFDSEDESIQLKALAVLSRYGRPGTDALASIIRRRGQTLIVRLAAAFFLFKAKMRSG